MPGRGWAFLRLVVVLREVGLGDLLDLRELLLELVLVVLLVVLLRREDVPPRVVLRVVLRLVLSFLRVVGFFFAIAQMFTL